VRVLFEFPIPIERRSNETAIKGNSREAATAHSLGRQPEVTSHTEPEAVKRRQQFFECLLPPLRGSTNRFLLDPLADARGYVLSPLRG
jgi:hypothetical protein